MFCFFVPWRGFLPPAGQDLPFFVPGTLFFVLSGQDLPFFVPGELFFVLSGQDLPFFAREEHFRKTGSEAADGFSLDDGRGEAELRNPCGYAVNAVKEDFGGQKGHVLHRLAYTGDRRLHVIHVGVVVE